MSTVGIGTTSPISLLHVSSANTGNTAIRIENTDTGGHNYALVSTGSTNPMGAGVFQLYDSTAASSRLIVNSSGNVGIGTTSPGTMLDVNGGIRPGPVAASNIGAACSPLGTQGYNATTGAPVYCSSSLVWTAMGSGAEDSGTICGLRNAACGNGSINGYDGASGGQNTPPGGVPCKGNTLTITSCNGYLPTGITGCPTGYTGGWSYTTNGPSYWGVYEIFCVHN